MKFSNRIWIVYDPIARHLRLQLEFYDDCNRFHTYTHPANKKQPNKNANYRELLNEKKVLTIFFRLVFYTLNGTKKFITKNTIQNNYIANEKSKQEENIIDHSEKIRLQWCCCCWKKSAFNFVSVINSFKSQWAAAFFLSLYQELNLFEAWN